MLHFTLYDFSRSHPQFSSDAHVSPGTECPRQEEHQMKPRHASSNLDRNYRPIKDRKLRNGSGTREMTENFPRFIILKTILEQMAEKNVVEFRRRYISDRLVFNGHTFASVTFNSPHHEDSMEPFHLTVSGPFP